MEDGHLWQLSLHHGPLRSAEKEGHLWVLDFVMSSASRFCFFQHVLKCQTPTSSSICLIVQCLIGASFSMLLSNRPLSWAGKYKRGERSNVSPSLPPCLLGASKKQQLRPQHRPSDEGGPLQLKYASVATWGAHLSLSRLCKPRRVACLWPPG